MLGLLAATARPSLRQIFPAFLCFPRLGIDLDSEILDVGCGSGHLLQTLGHFGFTKLYGVDQFIESDIRQANGALIRKGGIEEISQAADLVMFHHSLEHMVDPLAALTNAHRLLRSGKYCIVRIPIVAAAWERFGSDWVQLDAPRHVYLFTKSGFAAVANKAGFIVEHIVDDSTAFQFWGSAQVSAGVPLIDATKCGETYLKNVFGERIEEWETEAAALNALG
ncbi:MAG: class I SAM-dependent methyltransferase, partial [Pyrinomonadaceae bacterium]